MEETNPEKAAVTRNVRQLLMLSFLVRAGNVHFAVIEFSSHNMRGSINPENLLGCPEDYFWVTLATVGSKGNFKAGQP